MKVKKIVTHGGNAHFDELTACALALGYIYMVDGEQPPIYRVVAEISEEDLNDPEVWVIDVGGRHEPDKGNFDHHQFDVSKDGRCAISLVLQYMELYDFAKDYWSWLALAEINDTQGTGGIQRHFNITKSLIGLKSPIERFIVNQFSELNFLIPQGVLYKFLLDYGMGLIKELHEAQVRKVQWDAAKVISLGNLKMIDVSDYFDGKDGPLTGSEFFLKGRNDINLILSADDRGEGLSLVRRHNSTNKINLAKLQNHPLVSFAHNGGFVAKLKPNVTLCQVEELVRLAQ